MVELSDNADRYVIADAVRIQGAGVPAAPLTVTLDGPSIVEHGGSAVGTELMTGSPNVGADAFRHVTVTPGSSPTMQHDSQSAIDLLLETDPGNLEKVQRRLTTTIDFLAHIRHERNIKASQFRDVLNHIMDEHSTALDELTAGATSQRMI